MVRINQMSEAMGRTAGRLVGRVQDGPRPGAPGIRRT